MTTLRKNIATLAGIAVGCGFLFFSLRNVDLGQMAATLAASRWTLAIPFLLVLFLFYWLKAFRWQVLLGDLANGKTSEVFPAVMIGYAANAVLPMQLGELVRVFVAARNLSAPRTAVLTSLVLERVFDLVTILIVFGVTLSLGLPAPPELATAGFLITGLAVGLLVALMFYVYRTATVIHWLRALTARMPAVGERIIHHAKSGAEGLGALRSTRALLIVTGISMVQWALMGACVGLSLSAVGIEASLPATLLVLILTVIGVSLPTAPGYVGTIQIAFTLGLTGFGIPAEQAFAASVFYHALAYLSVVVGGIVFLKQQGIRPRELRSESL